MQATMQSDVVKHYPVLLNELISIITPQYGGTFIDCTFGQGGYTKKILSYQNTQVIALDRDLESKKKADKISKEFQDRFIFKNKKFSQLDDLKIKNTNVRGIIFDLGYSTTQIKDPKKGLSFNSLGDLNMQMGLNDFSAKEAINRLDEKDLEKISNERQKNRREIEQKRISFSLNEMSALIREGSIKSLPVIIKGDVDGSIDALSENIVKLNNDEVEIKVIHSAVGMVTESDVLLAEASDAVIIGFNVQVSSNAKLQASQAGVDIRIYSVIYNVVDDIKLALEGLLEPDKIENIVGKAIVQQQFKIPNLGFIAGSKVTDGIIQRNMGARLYRDEELFIEGKIESLKRFKDDVKDVKEGLECGIGVSGMKKYLEGDVIEVFEVKEVKRTLD